MPKILPDFLLVFGNVEFFNFLVKNSFRSFFDRTDKSQNSKLFIQDFEVLRKLTHSKSPLPTKRVMKIATTHKKSYLRFRDNKSLPPFVFYSKMEYKQDINIAKLNFLRLDIHLNSQKYCSTTFQVWTPIFDMNISHNFQMMM